MIQSKINLYSSLGNYELTRSVQNTIFNSLSARLKSVRDSFENLKDSHESMTSIISITSIEKLNLAISLRGFYTPASRSSFFILKKRGLTSFFKFPNLYNFCASELLKLSVLPLNNLFYSKYSSGFKPFRNSQDAFFEIKKFFKKSVYSNSLSLINFSFDSNIDLNSNSWFMKGILLNKQILKSWLNSYKYSKYQIPYFYSEITSYFISFLLSGLL